MIHESLPLVVVNELGYRTYVLGIKGSDFEYLDKEQANEAGRRCNSHDELLAALNDIMKRSYAWNGQTESSARISLEFAWTRARTAISKSSGGK